MVYHILIDLSHYERVHSMPDSYFPSEDYLFSFINAGDHIPSAKKLQKYDLLLIGDSKPKYSQEILWTPEELRQIKQYIRQGGKMLLTSSNRGDFNIPAVFGPLKVFYKLTGVASFPNALVFALSQPDYISKRSILRVPLSSQALPFGNFSENDFLACGKSTFLILHEDYTPEILINSPISTSIHDYPNKKKSSVGKQPLLVYRQYFKGLVVTSASSCFLTQNAECGIEVGANGKFFSSLINWMLNF